MIAMMAMLRDLLNLDMDRFRRIGSGEYRQCLCLCCRLQHKVAHFL
jgi:hypothetical protein